MLRRNNTILKEFWKVRSLPSAQVLAWKVLLDMVKPRMNLVRKGVGLNLDMCSLCQECEETT